MSALSRQAGLREEEARALGGLGDAFYLIGKMKSATEQFQLCLEICREQGYRRLEVENGYMAGYTRIFLNNLREGMAQFRDSFEMAVDTGHQRAEMLARNGLGHILCEFQRFGEARVEYQSGLEISRRLLAKRFEAEFLCSMGNIEAWQGNLPSAKTYMQEALALAEETGMGYFGTAILGNLAWVAEDAAEKKRLLAQGRNLLQKGSVSHNHFYFYRLAMDISLQSGEFSEAEGYAADLEAFTRDEPLPWSDFYMARTRALAALAMVENGEGGPGDGDALTETLHGLHQEGQRVGLLNALPALEAALERLS